MNLSAMNWDIKLQEIKSISLSPYTCLPLALMDETFFFNLHKICSKSQQVVLKSVGILTQCLGSSLHTIRDGGDVSMTFCWFLSCSATHLCSDTTWDKDWCHVFCMPCFLYLSSSWLLPLTSATQLYFSEWHEWSERKSASYNLVNLSGIRIRKHQQHRVGNHTYSFKVVRKVIS